MAKSTPLELFFNRFMLVNKERYKDDPKAMAILNSLTLEELDFANWRAAANENSQTVQMTVDLDSLNKLTATNQSYYTLDFASPLVSTPTDSAPVAEADLAQKGTGLYLYNDTSVTPNRLACAVVIYNPTDLYSEAVTLIKASCKFEIATEEISEVGSAAGATVSTKTFNDVIKILASQITTFLYDGTLLYDGSATY